MPPKRPGASANQWIHNFSLFLLLGQGLMPKASNADSKCDLGSKAFRMRKEDPMMLKILNLKVSKAGGEQATTQ